MSKTEQQRFNKVAYKFYENPADLVSKPKPCKDYINNLFWTTGPTFLQQEDNNWIEKYNGKSCVSSVWTFKHDYESLSREENPSGV